MAHHETNGTNGVAHHETNGAVHEHSVVAEPVIVPATPSRPAPLDRAQVLERLLGVVSERTGYPTEMLTLEADLEADLGIDSIKRVEIVGTLVRALVTETDKAPDMEPLTLSRTLHQLLDRLMVALAQESEAPLEVGSRRPFDLEPADDTVGRFIVRPISAPPITGQATLARDGAIMIVDDQTGVGLLMAAALGRQGYQVARVVPSASTINADDADVIAIDLNRSRCCRWVGGAGAWTLWPDQRTGTSGRSTGRRWGSWPGPGAVEHAIRRGTDQLVPPDAGAPACSQGGGGRGWRGGVGSHGTWWRICVRPPRGGLLPGHGGIAGFLKTLAQEEPSVRVKAVDLSPATAQQTAEWLLAELLAVDGIVEIGYRAGQRTALENVHAPLATKHSPLKLDSHAVVLVTGGARGITAEVAVRLAESYRPTYAARRADTSAQYGRIAGDSGPDDATALKRALIQQRRVAGSAYHAGQDRRGLPSASA